MLRKLIKSFLTFASVVYKMFYYQRRTNLVTLSRRALNDWSNLLINKYSKVWVLFTVEFQELVEIFWETYRLNSREFFTFLLFACKNVAFYTKQEFFQVLNFSHHTLVVAWVFFCFLSESIDCERKSLDFEGHTWNRGKCGDIHTYIRLADFLKTNVTKFAVIWVKKRQKARFLRPRSSKFTVTKEKERRKRKERGEGKEEKKKKQWLHS